MQGRPDPDFLSNSSSFSTHSPGDFGQVIFHFITLNLSFSTLDMGGGQFLLVTETNLTSYHSPRIIISLKMPVPSGRRGA